METKNTNGINVIEAGDGKVLRRISDGLIVGSEIYLGYTYYLGGERLEEPLFEIPEHYEETDMPEDSLPESVRQVK